MLKIVENIFAISGKDSPIAIAAPEIILTIKIKSKIHPRNLYFFTFPIKIPLNVNGLSGFFIKLIAKAKAGRQ